MGSRQKYIKDSGYEMEDDFTDALHKMPPLLAFKIGKYIENNLINQYSYQHQKQNLTK